MRMSRLCALFLSVLISLLKRIRTNQVSMLSGFLPLLPSQSKEYSACHECLVNSMGIEKIYLLLEHSCLRLYWVEGHSDIPRSFLKHCHSERKCMIHAAVLTNYKFHNPSMAIFQRSTDPYGNGKIESALFLLVPLIPFEGMTFRVFESNAYRKHKIPILMRKKAVSNSVLFKADREKTPYYRLENKILEPLPMEYFSHITQDQEDIDPRIRCMIIPGLSNDDACRECVAMHSQWLAFRSYLLYYKTRVSSAELLVFPSNYESSDIEFNCLKYLCTQIISWNSNDCQTLSYIFPLHHELTKTMRHKNENAMDLHTIRQALDVIAIRRRSGTDYDNLKHFNKIFAFPNTLGTMRSVRILCINITVYPNRKWDCIGCILKNVGGPRLVIISSLRKVSILISVIKKKVNCSKCRAVTLLESDECQDYRREAALDIETYPKLHEYEMLDQSSSNCIVLYHKPLTRDSCVQCIKQYFPNAEDPYALTKTSSLVETSKLVSKISGYSSQMLSYCVDRDRCTQIQEIRDNFCSTHAAFISLGSSQSVIRDEAIAFTAERIPVGIWPPQKHHILISRSESKSARAPAMWPFFPNNIVLVHFTYAESTFLDCAQCLLDHTGIFFVYNSESYANGYFWMRQAPSNVLQICVPKSCSSLAYDNDRPQLERPIGMRQLTKHFFVFDRARTGSRKVSQIA